MYTLIVHNTVITVVHQDSVQYSEVQLYTWTVFSAMKYSCTPGVYSTVKYSCTPGQWTVQCSEFKWYTKTVYSIVNYSCTVHSSVNNSCTPVQSPEAFFRKEHHVEMLVA